MTLSSCCVPEISSASGTLLTMVRASTYTSWKDIVLHLNISMNLNGLNVSAQYVCVQVQLVTVWPLIDICL